MVNFGKSFQNQVDKIKNLAILACKSNKNLEKTLTFLFCIPEFFT